MATARPSAPSKPPTFLPASFDNRKVQVEVHEDGWLTFKDLLKTPDGRLHNVSVRIHNLPEEGSGERPQAVSFRDARFARAVPDILQRGMASVLRALGLRDPTQADQVGLAIKETEAGDRCYAFSSVGPAKILGDANCDYDKIQDCGEVSTVRLVEEDVVPLLGREADEDGDDTVRKAMSLMLDALCPTNYVVSGNEEPIAVKYVRGSFLRKDRRVREPESLSRQNPPTPPLSPPPRPLSPLSPPPPPPPIGSPPVSGRHASAASVLGAAAPSLAAAEPAPSPRIVVLDNEPVLGSPVHAGAEPLAAPASPPPLVLDAPASPRSPVPAVVEEPLTAPAAASPSPRSPIPVVQPIVFQSQNRYDSNYYWPLFVQALDEAAALYDNRPDALRYRHLVEQDMQIPAEMHTAIVKLASEPESNEGAAPNMRAWFLDLQKAACDKMRQWKVEQDKIAKIAADEMILHLRALSGISAQPLIDYIIKNS